MYYAFIMQDLQIMTPGNLLPIPPMLNLILETVNSRNSEMISLLPTVSLYRETTVGPPKPHAYDCK